MCLGKRLLVKRSSLVDVFGRLLLMRRELVVLFRKKVVVDDE